MPDGDVDFLDPGSVPGGHGKGHLGGGRHGPAVAAAQSQGLETQLPGRVEPGHHVGRVAAGADAPGQVPGPS